MAQCKQLKPNHQRCKANATKNSDYCFSHDPALAEEKTLATTRGGQNRKLYLSYGKTFKKPQNIKDIKNLLGDLIADVLNGELPVGAPINSVAYLTRCYLDACEKAELETKVEELEGLVNQNVDSYKSK